MKVWSRRVVRLTCTALLLLSASASATVPASDNAVLLLGARLAGDLDATKSLWSEFQKKSFSGLFASAIPLAEAGSPSAQFIVAEMYLAGSGVEQSVDSAIKWLNLAATQLLPAACARLSNAYATGNGVPKDVERRRNFDKCWASSNASIAAHYASKTERVVLWHRPGEGPIHQYWLEQVRFYNGMERRSETLPETRQSGIESAVRVGSLPSACRPDRPPAYEMYIAKLDSVSGALHLYVDVTGRVAGFRFESIADERLRIPIFLAFQKSFQAEGCILPPAVAGKWVEVPFLFRVE